MLLGNNYNKVNTTYQMSAERLILLTFQCTVYIFQFIYHPYVLTLYIFWGLNKNESVWYGITNLLRR